MLRLFQRQAPDQAAHIEIAHDGEVYRIALKRVATSRRFTLRVRTATRDALLTMPSRSSLKAAREFAERHAAWIGARLARLTLPVGLETRPLCDEHRDRRRVEDAHAREIDDDVPIEDREALAQHLAVLGIDHPVRVHDRE